MAGWVLGEGEHSKTYIDHCHSPFRVLLWPPMPPTQRPPSPRGAWPTRASYLPMTPFILQMQLRGHLLQGAFQETPSLCGEHPKAGGTADHADAMLMTEDAVCVDLP